MSVYGISAQPATSAVPPANGQASKIVTEFITAQYLAKAIHYSKWERARDAAKWLRGEVVVVPTTKLASGVFGVSVPLIKRASENDKPHANGNGGTTTLSEDEVGGTTTLSEDEVDNTILKIGFARAWASFERLTQPSLSLQAAE